MINGRHSLVTPFAAYADLRVGDGSVIFALGHQAWGRGQTAIEAIAQWQSSVRAEPHKILEIVLVAACDRAQIDPRDGAVLTPSSAPRPWELMRVNVRVQPKIKH